jgi:hypothetical protein
VKVKVVLVASPAIEPETLGVTMKLPVLIVAGFIGLLNVALIRVVGQAVWDAIAGSTDTTAGGLSGEAGPPAFLSASLHPAITTPNIKAGIQALQTFNLYISFLSSITMLSVRMRHVAFSDNHTHQAHPQIGLAYKYLFLFGWDIA